MLKMPMAGLRLPTGGLFAHDLATAYPQPLLACRTVLRAAQGESCPPACSRVPLGHLPARLRASRHPWPYPWGVYPGLLRAPLDVSAAEQLPRLWRHMSWR